jgi:AraC-like DNA-binding protein
MTLVDHCQTLIRPREDDTALDLLASLEELLAGVPDVATASERLIARGVLAHVLACLLGRPGSGHEHGDLDALLTAFLASDPRSSLHAQLSELVARVSLKIAESELDASERHVDARVSRALRIIGAHHHDPALTPQLVAGEVHLSCSHLSRLLKEQTGRGFLAHLHLARVTAARRLLSTMSLTVKEVASRVGYSSTKQLTRHFRRVFATSPAAVRYGAARAVVPK